MSKYKLIIFDCDGTLVDSEPLTCRIITEMISEYGITITLQETINKFAGKTLKHITDFISETHRVEDTSAFEDDYRERCLHVFQKELIPIPGVQDFIDALDIPFCVASNGPKKKMDVTLPAAGLDHYFDEKNTFSAYDVQVWKPEPDLFLHAARQMNVLPADVLVIEDTWSGAMGAVNGQMDVWIYNAHLDHKTFINGVPNFTSFEDIQRTFFNS